MLPNGKSVSDLLRLPPVSLLSWVQQHAGAIDRSQDWQDLAYGTKSRVDVDSSLTDEEVAALATTAVLIYDRLGETCTGQSDRSYSTNNAMALRAVMIDKSGPQPSHPARDPTILEDWFFRQLNKPFEEVFSMSKNARNLSPEDFLRISSLKDRVRLMKSVQRQQVFRRNDELSKWYQLLDISLRSPTG